MDEREGQGAVEFRVLGAIEVIVNGRTVHLGPPKRRLLLALLALECQHAVSVDRLVDLMWDDPPQAARRVVFAHIARLRAALAGAAACGVELLSTPSGYVLRVDSAQVDAHRFQRQVAAATGVADPLARARLLGEALELWQGSALEDPATGPGARNLARGLENLRLSAMEQRIAAELAAGRHPAVVAELTQLVAQHPVREQLVGQLMLALYRCGDISAALQVYRRARADLATQLGVDPGSELTALHSSLLRRDPSLAAPPPAAIAQQESSAPDPAPRQLPASIRHFTGRADQLKLLHDLLGNGDAGGSVLAAVVISGTAGVGKTALAVHFSHQAAHRFPDGQLYVNLRGFDPAARPLHPAAAARLFLDALGVPPARIPADSDACLAMYRSRLADTRTLIVLDNARDAEQVRPLLLGAPRCLVLVTSRDRLSGLVALDGALPLALDLLTLDEARELLAARLGAERLAPERQAAEELIELCARLPLALNLALARAVASAGTPLSTLTEQLRDTRRRLDLLSAGEAAADVRAVLSWSYYAVDASTARAFRFLGLHPGPDITAAAAASLAGLPHEQTRAALEQLSRAHLLIESAPGRYVFHDLLRAYARERVLSDDTDDDRQAARHRMFDYYLHTAHAASILLNPHRQPITLSKPCIGALPDHPADHDEALNWFTDEQSVLVAITQCAAETGFPDHSWQLAWTCTTFFERRGRWQDLATVQNVALDAARRVGNQDGRANAHYGLARAYSRLGRLDEAHTNFLGAIELFRDLGDRIRQARTHLGLAWIRDLQGCADDSLDHARQAYELARTTENQAIQANALNAMGWYHAQLGDGRQALLHCRQALTLQQQLGDRNGQATTWDSLGYACHLVGQYEEALVCYRNALDLYSGLGDRYNEADTLTHLAETHQAVGNTAAAQDAWHNALSILDVLQHPHADRVRARLVRTA
ncbi:MAG TPA: BTAD domain-containing putative transcriptional regulator [Actinocrinis sp.]|uniref:AfsR/SARP family transcriptional regulator n=1 Tax=Actinocrinis sp. TaxID=1920516 RepID=UPI002DDCF1DD|nr:BTAD domain-containing putative transcriptional regulator [Actinocrinis sp.]HEV3172367.1 BTAD domain-containing putative transcriptional regulator [Actinocrinis sp.]